MDKHTRPYLCVDPECQSSRGFAHPANLLCHQREVHGQHGANACPHQDCEWSAWGFSRKEDMIEHYRTVHRLLGGDVEKSEPKVQGDDELKGRSECLKKPDLRQIQMVGDFSEPASAKKRLEPGEQEKELEEGQKER